MLGADDVLVGTHFWVPTEALVKECHHGAIVESKGDGTLRTRVADIARQIPWLRQFSARIRRNAFTDRRHGREDYRRAFMEGDPDYTGVWFGEAGGLIDSIEPAATIVERMVADAAFHFLRHAGAKIS